MDHPAGFNSPQPDPRFERLPGLAKALAYLFFGILCTVFLPLIVAVLIPLAIVSIIEWAWDATAPQPKRYVFLPISKDPPRVSEKITVQTVR